jgi:hypothetical protein
MLAELALLSANDKSHVLSMIGAFISAAESKCDDLMRLHSTFANDPAIESLRDSLREVRSKVPSYYPPVLEVATGIISDDYEYTNGNEVWRLREKDFAERGIPVEEDCDIDDVEWEDPLDVYKRLTGKGSA